MSSNPSSLPSVYFREEHDALRAQLRRFVEEEIKPHGEEWEKQGFVPREVLRRMGELGFLGIRYPADYGGSDMDVFGSVVLAEELGRCTFGGVAITVLVHTDMASVHMANAGSMFVVEKGTPGLRVSRALDKHGWRSSDTAEQIGRRDAAILEGELGG